MNNMETGKNKPKRPIGFASGNESDEEGEQGKQQREENQGDLPGLEGIKTKNGLNLDNRENLQEEREIEEKRKQWGERQGDLPGFELEKNESPEIKKAREELEEARNSYAREFYKADNSISRIKKIFKGKLATESSTIPEVQKAYAEYKNRVSELARLQLDELRAKNTSQKTLKKEMGDLIKYYNLDEKMNLFAARTNARAELNKDSKLFFVLQKSGQFINWYRKVNWKKKVAFGVGLGILTGGSLAIGQKTLGAVATGFTAKTGMEAYHRRKMQKESEQDKEKILEGFENSEEKFNKIIERLNGKIENYDKELDYEVSSAWIRNAIGVSAAGVSFLAGSLIAEKIGGLFHHGGEAPAGVDVVEKVETPKAEDVLVGGGNPDVAPAAAGGDPLSGLEGKPPVSSVVERIAEVKQGSSLEGTIIQYLNDNPKLVDEYNAKLGGGRSFDAGQIAHRMALDYAKENNLPKGPFSLIHEGAKIEFNNDGLSLKGISGDPNLGYLPEKEIPTGGGISNILTPDNIPGHEPGDFVASSAGEVPMERFEMNPDRYQEIAKINHDIAEKIDDIKESNSALGDWDDTRGIKRSDWIKIQENGIRNLKIQSATKYGSMFFEFLCNGDPANLNEIRDLSASQVFENKESGTRKIYEYLIGSKMGGENLKPISGEKVGNWVNRISVALADKAGK